MKIPTLTLDEKEKITIQESRNGRGIFSKKSFTPEEVVFEVTGTFMTCDEEDGVDDETRANTYRYDKGKYISPKGRIGDFLNHSCAPNAKVVKYNDQLFVTAIKNILTDDEVTIDYSTILAPDDLWEMKCNCGSQNCRGIIKKIDLVPFEIRQKYLSLGMIPSYIF